MSLEAVMIAIDNSSYMRNGDYHPSRMHAQSEAVSMLCHHKQRCNHENTVGLLSMAECEVLSTLTSDVSKVYSSLHLLEPKGNISFCTSVRVAQLALKHRQLRHQQMRVICFVGSPVLDEEKDLITLAKRLKKENVNVDLISFGETEENSAKLSAFVNTLNGTNGDGSHLVTVLPGAVLKDSLYSSPIVAKENDNGGMGMEFGMEGAEDFDLLYALRVSMEEQRMRHEQEGNADPSTDPQATAEFPVSFGNSEEAMLQQALAMSMQTETKDSQTSRPMDVDVAAMTEEDQIAYALRMSLQPLEELEPTTKPDSTANAMDIDQTGVSNQSLTGEPSITDASELDAIDDATFLENVLQTLPGVDPTSEDVRNAIDAIAKQRSNSDGKDKKKDK